MLDGNRLTDAALERIDELGHCRCAFFVHVANAENHLVVDELETREYVELEPSVPNGLDAIVVLGISDVGDHPVSAAGHAGHVE